MYTQNLNKNSFFSLIALGINIGVRILTAPMVVKNFNQDMSGLYYFVLNITNYFLFFDFGISRAFLFIKIKNSDIKTINTTFFTSVLFYLFIVIALFLCFYTGRSYFLKNINSKY